MVMSSSPPSPSSMPSLSCSTMAIKTTFHSMSHEHKTCDDNDDKDNDKNTTNKNDIINFKRISSAGMIVKVAVLVVAFLAAAAAAASSSVLSPTKSILSIAVCGGGVSNNNDVNMDKDDDERESSTIHNRAMNYLRPFSLFASLFNNDFYTTQLLRRRRSRKLQEGEERGGGGRGEEEEYHPGAIYTCSHFWLFGPQYDGLGADLFPEYRIGGAVKDVVDPTNTFTKNDIIMTHPGYDCDSTGLPSLTHPDLRTGRRSGPWDFPGKVLYVNGEWHMKPHLTDKRDYHLGYIEDDERSRKVYWISIVLQYGPYRAVKDAILDPNKRPTRNTGKYFLLYAASNCIDYRDEAFDKLSQIDIVHYGGECHGKDYDVVGEGRKMRAPRAEHFQRDKQGLNSNFYHDYRFSLVMENKYQDGYISEKILNVFYAGSIPVWYGTTEIFDVINPKAFVYYDVNHPQEALNHVAYLERNQSAYEEMLNEPILADESLTIAKYFSLSDDVGHGILKTRIRRMMDLPEDAVSLTGS